MATLDIIIPNWNTGTQLRACLESLVVADRRGIDVRRVCVVDNASWDGSADNLDDLSLPLVCIRNPSNRGFAAACNQAARLCDATYLLFLNPDTCVRPDSLTTPVAFLEAHANSRTGIVGIQLVNAEGAVIVTCARFPTAGRLAAKMLGLERLFPRVFPGLFMSDWDHGDSREVDHVTGAFFLVRRSVFEALHGFDERFFVYLEDLDFSLRARTAGWRTVYLATTQAYHKGGGSSEQVKAARLFYSLQSQILYGYKHFGWPVATALTLATLSVEFLARLARGAVRGSLREIIDTTRGYAMLWGALPRVARATRRPHA